jgi:ribosomal protein S6
MKNYELHIIVNPNLSEAQTEALAQKTKEMFSAKEGFEVSVPAIKYNQNLSYPIKHINQSHIINFAITNSLDEIFPEEINSILQREENILRHLIFKKSNKELAKSKATSAIDFLINKSTHARSKTLYKHEKNSTETSTEPESKTESAPLDIGEIDKKLEELLK